MLFALMLGGCDQAPSERAHAYAVCRARLAVAATRRDSADLFREGAGWNSFGGSICAQMVGEEIAAKAKETR